jgi:hypothetical protein
LSGFSFVNFLLDFSGFQSKVCSEFDDFCQFSIDTSQRINRLLSVFKSSLLIASQNVQRPPTKSHKSEFSVHF